MSVNPFTAATAGPVAGPQWTPSSLGYPRPLNVRDALSYLDQVKIRFVDQPDVYNRFLDVMKEFKGQVIDTPGVIDRVSTLFRGHPTLISGFNTFLPPGYRIECFGTEGDPSGLITVTTPLGTVSQVPGGFAAAMDEKDREVREAAAAAAAAASVASAATVDSVVNGRASPSKYGSAGPTNGIAAVPERTSVNLPLHHPNGPPPFAATQASRSTPAASALPPVAPSTTANIPSARLVMPVSNTVPVQSATPGPLPIPPLSQQPVPASGPSTPSAAHFLASGGLGGSNPPQSAAQAAQPRAVAPVLEFNHAISFVNKIKNRFDSDPETYKQFLEILQTYQRETRDIAEVYEQVRKLFKGAPDLIEEFKQFLPENGSAGVGFGSFIQAAAGPTVVGPPEKVPGPKRGSKDNKDTTTGKKRRGGPAAESKTAAQKRSKQANKADSPSGDDGEALLVLPNGGAPQTLASPDEVAFFDKVKKFVDDKVTYHEFLKLINLFTQDMIDLKTLVERAELFIGQSGDVWSTFKRLIGADEAGNIPPNPTSAQGGYGFGGMIGVDSLIVENTPMLERVKPDLSGAKVKSFGPSYRKLPKSEVSLQCTGRDSMCWQVLNDEWVSHPTWAAEDAAPFMAHKKNAYEEALHKSEEERHEYDYHIEANLRTIALLEPLNNKIQTMDAEERARFNLKAGIGGQSKSIYQRIVKKVYGKELGPEIIRALHDNPLVALPIVLERLKAKDEEWKKAQREWNRVWREQDAKNFYKALDHQGVQFKANDKKTLAAKSMIAEIEARRREQTNSRAAMLDPSSWRSKAQFVFHFADIDALKDVLKLVISYLDRVNNALSVADKDRIEQQLRELVPVLFMLDKDEFDAEFGDAEHGTPEDQEGSEDTDGDVSMAEEDDTASAAQDKRGKKVSATADLRKRLLKQVGEKDGREKRGSTGTPGPEESGTMDGREVSAEGTPMTDDGERGETPLPVPADPHAVAEAVEKDKAVADASEQTWLQVDTPEMSNPASEGSSAEAAEPKPKSTRKANFFANNHFYVLVRLIQIMYDRLTSCKEIAQQLSREKKSPINPVAIKLGLAEPETQYFGIESGDNPAQHYYTHLLSMAERLFENEVDIGTYEETLRLMFGTKAYIMFTLDRVVAAIVKQTQTILGDMKSQELFALLQRDRSTDKTTTRQQIAYRMQAESVLGPEENLYKLEYHHGTDSVSVQLLGREDLTIDDAETAQEKWRQYIESYVLTHPTEGLPHRVDQPFLIRNLGPSPGDATPETFDTKSGIEIKIALGNYRMFFTPDTEDYFHRQRLPAAVVEFDLRESSLAESSKKRLGEFVERARQSEISAESG